MASFLLVYKDLRGFAGWFLGGDFKVFCSGCLVGDEADLQVSDDPFLRVVIEFVEDFHDFVGGLEFFAHWHVIPSFRRMVISIPYGGYFWKRDALCAMWRIRKRPLELAIQGPSRQGLFVATRQTEHYTTAP